MLVCGPPFVRRKDPVPSDHPVWDVYSGFQRQTEESKAMYSSDKFTLIGHPFDDLSLQDLTSHIHPFCVIVKAARALRSSLLKVSPELQLTVRNVILIDACWSETFPSTSLGAVSTPQAPPSPDAGLRRSPRYTQYGRPSPYPAPGLGGNRG
jgi:hypothetical protein